MWERSGLLGLNLSPLGVSIPVDIALPSGPWAGPGPSLVLDQQICLEPFSVPGLVLHGPWPREIIFKILDHLPLKTLVYSAHWPISFVSPLGAVEIFVQELSGNGSKQESILREASALLPGWCLD